MLTHFELEEMIKSLNAIEKPAPPQFPYDVVIFCSKCACHYTRQIRGKDDWAECPTHGSSYLAESSITKYVEKYNK